MKALAKELRQKALIRRVDKFHGGKDMENIREDWTGYMMVSTGILMMIMMVKMMFING